MTTITLPATWDEKTAVKFAGELVKQLPPLARQRLAYALEDAAGADREAQLLQEIREFLGDDLPHVAGLAFTPMNYDNGDYFNEFARIFYTDGRDPLDVELSGNANDILTELYGRVAASAGLAIIPATGEHEYEDCGSDFDSLSDWITTLTAHRAPAGAAS